MIKLTINNAKTHLPLKKAKGTYQARTRKAAELNEQFFENLKGTFVYGNLSLNIFSQILKKFVPKNINLEVIADPDTIKSYTSLYLDNKGKINGYILSIPVDSENKISKFQIGNIMQSTLELFTRILNPKINNRGVNTINKNINNSNQQKLSNIICSSKTLTETALDNYLSVNTNLEKIDILQNIRYIIKLKLNKYRTGNKYQKEIEKLYRYKNMPKAEPVKYTTYKIPQKMKLLEQKLAEIIKEERRKTSVQ